MVWEDMSEHPHRHSIIHQVATYVWEDIYIYQIVTSPSAVTRPTVVQEGDHGNKLDGIMNKEGDIHD